MIAETCETPATQGSEVIPDNNNPDHNADEASGETVREKEIGGRDGPDPTRFGDWEKNGRCIDF